MLDLYSETEYPRVAGWSPLQALTDGRWMTIRAGATLEVYDLRADPRQEYDLSASQASVGSAMSARAGAIHAAACWWRWGGTARSMLPRLPASLASAT